MENLYIHIGIQRTGSTFLQQEIFPKISDVNLINLHRHQGLKFKYLPRNHLQKILRNIELYEKKRIEKELIPYIKSKKINLITNENIWWQLHENIKKREERIKKIKTVFPDAKIIFGIRRKEDLVISFYKKYVVRGGIFTFREFKKNILNYDMLNYEPYINLLLKLFGEKNVHIYKFEIMKTDIHRHVKNICDFMNVESPNFDNVVRNVGYSHWQLKLSLLLNNLYKTKANPKGFIPLEYKWHPHRMIFQSSFFPKKFRGKKVRFDRLP